MKTWIGVLSALVLMLSLVPMAAAETETTVDLTVSELSWTGGDGQVTPDTELTVSVKVTNEGMADAAGPIALTLSFGQECIRKATVAALAAGETVTVTFDAWTATAGDRMMVVAVDTESAVAESEERNNSVQRNLRVANDRLESAYEYTADILEKAGMTDLIFNDDFDDASSVDNDKSGAAGYKWYLTRPYGAADLAAGDYAVENGVMTVKNVVPTYNYGLGTRDMDTRQGFDFNTGYLEVKLRIPRPRKNAEGEKGAPAIWTLPSDRLYGSTPQWVELDWMEYWGEDYYTVTFHEMKANDKGENIQWNKNSNNSFHGLGDGEWHVMGWLWQEGLFITYLDGEEVMRLSWAEGEFSWPVQVTVNGEMETGVFTHLDTQLNPIIIGGSADNPMELDYVRVFDGEQTETFVPEKIEEKDEPIVVQMPAEDFVYNYTSDAYGEPIVTVTDENVSFVLAGEEVWLTLDEQRRAEVNALLAENGQSDFETLLAAAKALDEVPSPETGDTALPMLALLLCAAALGVMRTLKQE